MMGTGQKVGSNQGRNPVQWGRKNPEMAPDPRGSREGCCLGYFSLMGWVWLKIGSQGNGYNQAGWVCDSGSLRGCVGVA